MAAFTTVITQRNDTDNRRVYTIDGSTTSMPRLLIQKRVEAGPTGVSKDTLSVVYGTEDAAGSPLASKVVFEASIKRPNDGSATVLANAKAAFLDFLNSDQFGQMVTSQDYVQN